MIVVTASLVALSFLRQQIESRTTLSAQYLSRSVEQTLEGMVDAIDIALLASADDITRQMRDGKLDRKAVTAMLVRHQSRLPLVDNIRASNERGESLYGPDSQSPPVRIDDRDYFARPRDDPKAALFVSQPIVGRHKQKWIWLFSRRIAKPDGSFGGVVFASVLVEQIEKLLSHVKMNTGSSVALRDEELNLIARYTFGSTNPIPVGDKRLSAPFVEAVKVNPEEGSYFSDASSVDALPRSYSYHRNTKYGFTVNVGIPIEAALADWRREAWTIGGLVFAFVVAMLAFLMQVSRAWRRQDQDLTDRIRADVEVRTLSRAMEQSPASVVITDRAGNIEYVNPRFEQVTGYTRSEAVGKNPRILKSGIVSDEVYAQLWAAISAGNEWRGELCNRRKNGELFWEYAAISGLKDPGGEVGHFVAVKEDISERKAAESKLRRVNNLYAALSQCNQAVVHCATEQELFQQICRAIVNYGGMKMAWIGMVDKVSKRARHVAAYGDNIAYLEDLEISVEPDTPAGRGPTGVAIRENRPYWCQDFQNDPATAYWRESGRIAGWGGSASVPLRRNGAVIGALTLYSKEVNAFDEAARSLLVEMGGNISFALDHFVHEAERSHAEKSLRQAHEQLRQLAMRLNRMHEAESNLLSRELHDEFGQMLTRLKMDLSWLALRLSEANSDLKKKVDASLELVDASVNSVRSIAARLRPRILDELGLLPAIDWLVQDFRERSGIDAAFVAEAQVGTLSSERATAVFRIVQESLSNIARHADAKCIDVSLHEENGWLTLEVRDDGKGVREDEKTSYESIGLLGMRERALAAGGKIMFDSVLGRGTVVTLRLPVAETDA